MADLATALKEAAVAEKVADRHPHAPAQLKPSHLDEGERQTAHEVHCYEPWIIASYITGSERRAEKSLIRDGWEVFHPGGRNVGYLPQNQIPPKKRYRKGYFLKVDVRYPYPGYIFIRRVAPLTTPLFELWRIDGVQGVCMFGEQLATMPDFQIEIMRLHQDAGDYDRFDERISAKVWRLAEIRVTEAAKDRWTDERRSLGRLDTNQGTIHFIEEFGRITRIITRAGDQHIER